MIENIITLISQFGFPVVVCLISFWYINKREEENREERQERDTQHQKEVAALTTAINNNTLVQQKIVDILEVESNEGN